MGGGDGPGDERLVAVLTYSGGDAHLALAGALDLAGIPHFEALVASAFVRADHCEIDIARLAFVDSSGIRALLRARRRAAESGATLGIVNASADITRVLTEAGVKRVIGD